MMWLRKLLVFLRPATGLVLLLSLAVPLGAAEPPAPAVAPPAAEATKAAPPTLAEVVPQASQVTTEAEEVRRWLGEMQSAESLMTTLAKAEARLQELQGSWERWGALDEWRLELLLEQRGKTLELSNALTDSAARITDSLTQLDAARTLWAQRLDYWKQWKQRTPPSSDPTLRDVGDRTAATVKETLALLGAALPALVAQQQRAGALGEQLNRHLADFDQALLQLRQQVFRKNASPLLHPETLRGLTPALFDRLAEGWRNFLLTDTGFFKRNLWLTALQLLLALGVGLFLRHRPPDQVAAEWEPFLAHPWATGMFAGITFLSALYDGAPGWWRFTLLVAAATAALCLVYGLTARRLLRQAFVLVFFASIAVRLGELLSVPPLFERLINAAVALGVAVGLALVSRRSRQEEAATGSGFRNLLTAGAACSLLVWLAQMFGFTVLAGRFLQALLGTFWLVLFLYLTIHFGRGLIDFLLSRPALRGLPFFQKAGDTVRDHGKKLFQVLMMLAGLFPLVRIWGLTPSDQEAWRKITGWSVTVGNFEFSLAQLLGVAVAIYLATMASWALRLFLDTEIYPRRKVELGIGESINRLLHYLLVLIGLLFAASLAGIEMKNFAVLAGAFGIGIGFGLQNIVNNFVSGLILLFERPVKVGDTLVLNGEWGTVRKIGLRSTVIETFDRAETIVPNSVLIQEQVTNWTLSTPICRLVIPVGVAYGTDLERVLKLLTELAHSHPKVLKWPEPSAIFTAFGESSLDCELRVFLSSIEFRLAVRSELGVAIQRSFLEEGIEIPFPQQDLHLRSVDPATLRLAASAPGLARPDSD